MFLKYTIMIADVSERYHAVMQNIFGKIPWSNTGCFIYIVVYVLELDTTQCYTE